MYDDDLLPLLLDYFRSGAAQEDMEAIGMTRTLDSFQEVGWKSDNGCYIRTNAILEAAISVTKKYRRDEQGREIGDGYRATFIISAIRTGETIAVYDREFPTVESLMEDLGIEDTEEVWEVLE